MFNTQLAMISLIVRDQEEALYFYTEKLGLEKRVDITYGPGLRLLTVAAKGQRKPEIALAKPAASLHGEERIQELMRHNKQSLPWIFTTDHCYETYTNLLERGVRFVSPPTECMYGVEAIFEDPSGNVFSLLEPSPEARSLFESRGVGTAA